MSRVIMPALWLIVLVVGLPQLSETVYTPSFPAIAHALSISEAMVEHTLTIYLMGFALGTLFWGNFSDKFGRKPCVLSGLIIFGIGCIGCFFSSSFTMLMTSRFVQAFGGSIGSVLGQAICRDAFQGPALGRAYSVIGSALALFPALGPVVGGEITQRFGWPPIFMFLLFFALVLTVLVWIYLPETRCSHPQSFVSLKAVSLKLCQDPQVIGLGLIVAACNGLSFSYFAEGSFCLITMLGLSPSQYGASFMAIALSTTMGGLVSKKLQARQSPKTIMTYGIYIMVFWAALMSSAVIASELMAFHKFWLIGGVLISQMGIMFGVCMATSNALALALVNYKWCIGTASSVFGFFYYAVISLFTFGMGMLHNGTLLPMPLYFLGIGLFMVLINACFKKSSPVVSA